MEIGFDSRTQIIYRELSHQVKRVQECAESVVPDINDDIGRIASVQTAVLLKSKDITGKGVLISGEATAALLYITENENSVSYVNLSKIFTLEYEVPDMDADTLAHISLSVTNSEARILNPRKVSVTFELCGELSCYKQGEIKVDTVLPEHGGCLHARYETVQAELANAVCEKTFTVNEQYAFPGGKPAPARLVSVTADFTTADIQHIGTKIILKGNVNVCACYLSNEVNYPLRAEFSSVFSQIVDIGTENMSNCTATVALTTAYYDLTESISGEKLLDTELHAVVQMVSRFKQEIKYISDVYSNLMPAECAMESSQIKALSELKRLKLSGDERIGVVEDCTDVLSVFTSVSQVAQQQGKLAASVTLDIVYRTKSGGLSAVRRLENLEGEFDGSSCRLLGVRLTDAYLRPDGAFIDTHISLEAAYQTCLSVELARVEAVMLRDESPYELDAFPALTLVRAENESLWDLAKAYHSSVEKIAAMNELDGGTAGKLLIIPKCE